MGASGSEAGSIDFLVVRGSGFMSLNADPNLFSRGRDRVCTRPSHCGPEQPIKQTEVLGHSLFRSLVGKRIMLVGK